MTTYIGSPVSAELAAEVDAFLHAVREADDPRAHRAEGVDLVLRLTRESLDFYFLRSVRLLGLGAMAQGAVRLGLETSIKGIGVFVRSIGRGMSAEQIVQLTHQLEELMLEVDDGGDEDSDERQD